MKEFKGICLGLMRFLGILLCIWGGPAWGKTIFSPDLGTADDSGEGIAMHGGKKVQTPQGGGWTGERKNTDPRLNPYVDLSDPRGVLAGKEGAVEFWVQNISSPEHESRLVREGRLEHETLLSLMNEGGIAPVVVYIVWQPHNPISKKGQSYISFDGIDYRNDVWPAFLPVGRKVQPGEWLHVAISWSPVENRVLVDGREIFRGSNSGALVKYMGDQFRIRLGVDSRVAQAGSYPLVNSVIAGIKLYDRSISRGGQIISVEDDAFKAAGISGKLVAGDRVTVVLRASPGGKASFDMGAVRGVTMDELPTTQGGPGIPAVDNGTYRGSYTILPGEDYENGQIMGNFVSSDNVAAESVLSSSRWTIDTKPMVTFQVDRKDLPADSSSKARIKLVAKDANGNPVKGRHLKLTLATTSEYTGTVGAGDFGKDVGATVETRWKGETDSWGEVEFDYKAGFAAKTVILTAKDLDSGGVSVDYITAFVEASIDIALTAPVNRAAARRGMQYLLKVEASRTELTADGRSRSVIRATLLDPNGAPVAGDPVAFTLSSANGTLRTIAGTTDSSGTATVEYTAGKKIGIVVVTATATLRNATGNVSITLLSDAPAKVILKARPATLPADGNSRTDIGVKVTDINDNPNADTKVEFKIARGGGRLDYPDRLTDRFGDGSNRYTAGTIPGTATVVATVRSKVPTEAELARARNVLFVPYSADGDEIRIEKWLMKKGDRFMKGDPLVEYTVGRSSRILQIKAPVDGVIGDLIVELWDRAEVGQTLGLIVPAVR